MMKQLLTVMLLGTLIFSCSMNQLPEENSPVNGGGGENYTPVTKLWDLSGDSEFSVYTDDKKFIYPYQPSGVRFWKLMDTAKAENEDVSADLNKISGDNKGSYGLLFSADDSSHCLMLLLDTKGLYCVMKIHEGVKSYVKDWTYTVNLKQGYNQRNRVRIVNLTGGQYRLFLNDVEETVFTDNKAPVRTWGKWGFTASVYSQEVFPDHPVDVRFRY